MCPGPQSPNNTQSKSPGSFIETCGRTAATGCLYDIYADPNEHVNLARAKPDVFAALLARVDELQEGVYSPQRSDPAGPRQSPAACQAALGKYGGFWGPFLD